MLSAYNRRLLLTCLSNAVTRFDCDTTEAKNLTKWFLKHQAKLKCCSLPTLDGKTAIVKAQEWDMPPVQWKRLSETLRGESAAAKKARPDQTANRLRRLAKAMCLTRVDTAILELVLRNHTVPLVESMMDTICERGWWNGTGFALTTPVLPGLLGISTGAFFRRFAPDAPLVRSGLVSIEDNSHVTVIDRLTRLHWRPKTGVTDVRGLLLDGAGPAGLRWSDFDHVAGDRDHIERILKGALRTGREGVNLLVHGPPGAGKTEFCKTLAARLQAPLYVVGESDDNGDRIWSTNRWQELRLAQRLLSGNHGSILLFDEMEDLLSTHGEAVPASPGSHGFPELSAIGTKVTMNRLLEQTPVPILWTSNAARRTSPVLLRRMMFALELRHPPAKVRERVWNRQLAQHGIECTEEDVQALARDFDVAPGVASGVTAAAKLATGTISEVRRGLNELSRLLSGGRPTLQGVAEEFDPALLCADLHPVQLTDRLASSGARHFSLCLQGPPGTGKSAFVRYLAGRLGLEVLQKRASDLISMWIGQTESNIREAFAEARDAQAFLIFDEADSLLADRRLAHRNWEVSQVNEMLTWMENHSFPVAFTTNYRERLDPATLRRFTFKVTLDYLTPEQSVAAFRTFFDLDAPVEIAALAGLTPGDFSVVRRKAEILDCLGDLGEVMEMLRAECEAKPDLPRRAGFR